MRNFKYILNILSLPHSGSTLLKTLLCENENFLNFPEIKHPVLFSYFYSLLKLNDITKDDVVEILNAFYNTINKKDKEVIIQKFPAERFRNISFLESVYATNINFYVLLKRRLLDFKSVNQMLQTSGPHQTLSHIRMLYDGYRMAYEDFLSVDKHKRVMLNFEKMIIDPGKEISKILIMLGYEGIKFKNKKYSNKVEWEGNSMFIDCKEEDRERINTGKIHEDKAETYKLLPRDFIKKILDMEEIIMFEERMGSDIDSVRKFVKE